MQTTGKVGTTTWFASPERAEPDDLRGQIQLASSNELMKALLTTVGGLLAVLNRNRQVVALNQALLDDMGIADPGEVMGLRMGEAVGCVHADEMPGGCGTSRYCSSCGAAIAIVVCQTENVTQERKCVITVEREQVPVELCFSVRAVPIELERIKFTLLFLQDVTRQERLAELEKVFLHDISNTITCLLNYSNPPFVQKHGGAELMPKIHELSLRLADEVELQKTLVRAAAGQYSLKYRVVSFGWLLQELFVATENHPAAEGVDVEYSADDEKHTIVTDPTILLRILGNMVINGMEASSGEAVRVRAEADGWGNAVFSVWNRGVMPPEAVLRVFQRFFTTKPGEGRGHGTFSMKLLGEKVLGGKVDFQSSEGEGTVFRLILPLEKEKSAVS